ncbi:FadR family transcriptional regulator [Rhodovastum atsumiense]|uniref:FadR family transcriptional regulator n=1 Tax=Rhodovastum atsumiense TaxID=504468 RepID=A0A5M6IMI1_9PROT|nr:FadR/GntR family transcriptional regulator [Rhodovastum atsumiense]KAA5609456.1 FadR family transcriptional regulator [Rhodovastum atsumiense]CAH2603538.1 FadR family transcriptional regulator [Rhodovastum atsumiense]
MPDQPEITRQADGAKGDGRGFEKVFAFLRERLLTGTLRPGDRLTPERELAAQLGVSRPILREALRALTALGIVEIRDRVGTVVRRPDLSVLNDFFTFALAQQGDAVDDVMEARIAIECQAIRLAARRATLSDLARLQQALARISETIGDPRVGSEADYDFHRAIVAAARSEALSLLHEALTPLLRRSHFIRREEIKVVEQMQPYLIDDHRRIFEAIAARDPEAADRILREHFAIGDEYRRRAIISR